jgi:hypothetical protein
MFFNQSVNPLNFGPRKTTTTLQSRPVKPELGHIALTLDMHMRWLILVTRVKKEAVRTVAEHRRHAVIVS